MAFDPAKPTDGSPLASSVMRDQFNGLNELIYQAKVSSASNVNHVEELFVEITEPPNQEQVVKIVQKLNELIIALHR